MNGPICRNLGELHSSLLNLPERRVEHFHQSSRLAFEAATCKDYLPVYSIHGKIDIMIRLGMLLEDMKDMKQCIPQVGEKPAKEIDATAVIIVSQEHNPREFEAIVAFVEMQLKRKSSPQLNGNAALCGNVAIIKGLPRRPSEAVELRSYLGSMNTVRSNVKAAVNQTWKSATLPKIVWHESSRMDLLVHMLDDERGHEVFKAITITSGVNLGGNGLQIRRGQSGPLAWQKLLHHAKAAWVPILLLDKLAMDVPFRDISCWKGLLGAWPAVLPGQAIELAAPNVLDALVLSVFRLRAALDGCHGEACVRGARRRIPDDLAKYFARRIFDANSYSEEDCTLAKALASTHSIARYANAPFDAEFDGLLGRLVDPGVAHGASSAYAARVELDLGQKTLRLSEDASTFLLIRTKSCKDMLLIDWRLYLQKVRKRQFNATIDNAFARRWLELVNILKDELIYITRHENFGKGWKDIDFQPLGNAWRALDEGIMTKISKQSLKKKRVRFIDGS